MARSIEPAAVSAPPPTKKISSAVWIVFKRWAMITLVVDLGSFASTSAIRRGVRFSKAWPNAPDRSAS